MSICRPCRLGARVRVSVRVSVRVRVSVSVRVHCAVVLTTNGRIHATNAPRVSGCQGF